MKHLRLTEQQYEEIQKRNRMDRPGTCEFPGCELPIGPKSLRFCSRKHANQFSWNQRRKPDDIRTCAACGVQYRKTAGSRGVVCSIRCWASVQAKARAVDNYSRAKSGTRPDLGIYVRSAWEANWARYLNWLQKNGQIKSWAYEPDTFEFLEIKRGTRFYTPDFKITENDGEIVYHEIKGYMDQKSRTKLDRMARYHPDVRIRVIDLAAYR